MNKYIKKTLLSAAAPGCSPRLRSCGPRDNLGRCETSEVLQSPGSWDNSGNQRGGGQHHGFRFHSSDLWKTIVSGKNLSRGMGGGVGGGIQTRRVSKVTFGDSLVNILSGLPG